MTIEELGKKVKEKYPQYNSVNDKTLGEKFLIKYPVYQSRIDGKSSMSTTTSPDKKSTLRKVADFLTSSEQKFGDTLGQAVATMDKSVQQNIDTANKTYLDTAKRWEDMARMQTDPVKRQNYIDKANESYKAAGSTYQAVLPAINKTNKQILGEASGVGLDVLTAGTLGNEAKAVTEVAPTALREVTKKSLVKGALQGAKEGAKYGAAYGATGAAQDNQSVVDGAATGTVAGVAIGGVAGGVSTAIGNKIAKNAMRKAEIANKLENKVPEASLATRKVALTGEIIKDKTAKEVIRQGIPEADVALIKNSSKTDKEKMAKMLQVRENQLSNKRVTQRATDVVGDTFLKMAQHIEGVNKDAGKNLDKIAKGLSEKSVDTTPMIQSFTQDLEGAGITVGKKRKLGFKGSAFEGIKPAQRTLQEVYDRATQVSKSGDALQIHRMKRYIDNMVSYEKKAEGLPGDAERILKGLRHNADAVLDNNFEDYNKVNQVFAETRQEMDNIKSVLGKKMKSTDSFANTKAGTTLRGIFSNNQSRANLMSGLESMQRVAKKYGMKIDEDIITQANFADVLEKMFGSEAPTSFTGSIERALGTSAQAAQDLAQGNVPGAVMKGGKAVYEKLRGVNEKNRSKALRKLLSEEVYKKRRTRKVSAK
ncbi:MAG: hypothetical protein PHQ46_10715 [Negativicutes bacterium]|nr:hypothetical protein [Negativicutes bacterium]